MTDAAASRPVAQKVRRPAAGQAAAGRAASPWGFSRSIGRRLTILLAGIAAVLALVSWAMVTSFARAAAERTQDGVLAASALSIAGALGSEQGNIRLELPYSAFAMLDAIGQDRVFYRVATADDTLTGYEDLEVPRLPRTAGEVVTDTIAYRGTTVRVATVTRSVLSGQVPVRIMVSVAQTRSGVDEIAAGLSRSAAALSVGFFLLATGLGWAAARNSLRPLNEIAQAVGRRGPSDLRPVQRDAPGELAPLLAALNRLMERLGASIRRSEDFITEAAHRVRTPLATVRAQAEVALHSAESEEVKATLRRMIRAVDESSRSAGQLLDHATVGFRAETLRAEDLDLAAVIRRVTDGLAPTAEMKDIAFSVSLVPAPMRGDAILLENAVRNVLDNAVKYSPAETVVTVTLERAGSAWRITIRDEGRGFGDAAVPQLVERFRRGANVEKVVGSGLGLTIADEALRAHGGTLTLSPGDNGVGACVTLTLPAA
ncbi:sensor histidine kinase [Roseibacterium sp. SDUM158016]|uniref:sensor histidine kinase n=1 Tax=Roseicyclus sediminis TaxID=2980997 RepID=UPI0021CF2095|nr:sensor histidine kinase [Roseibacterium sp. SDUM158016]MCU4651990.1 sensor histidine kinase [Roseibacterium sp. SDUM158016]